MTDAPTITFGALVPTLAEQLTAQGFGVRDQRELACIQIIADAIATVTIQGFMPHSQSDRARKRLAKRLSVIVTANPASPSSPGVS